MFNADSRGNPGLSRLEDLESRLLLSASLFPVRQIDLTSVQSPTTVLAADLNGDGKQDLVTLGSVVLVQRGLGAAQFASGTSYLSDAYHTTGSLIDVDGDHDLDIVTLRQNGKSIAVLLNDGSGNFGQSKIVSISLVTPTEQFASGDFDRDGDVDLALRGTNPTTNAPTLSLFRNDGLGNFTELAPVTAPSSSAMVAGDFDHDGDADLALGLYRNDTDNVLILRNNGAGTFTTLYFRTGYYIQKMAVGDLDSDGDLDLAVGGGDFGVLQTLTNNGSGIFSNGTASSSDLTLASLGIADVDLDGRPDVVATSGQGVRVLRNLGSGNFALNNAVNIGDSAVSSAIADIDGDAQPDLIVANAHGKSISLALNDGHGTWIVPTSSQDLSYAAAIANGDVNGDGLPDILVAENGPSGALSVRLNQGRGIFGSANAYSTIADPNKLVLADLDNDGDLDVATISSDTPASVAILLNRGDGTFTSGQTFSLSTQAFDIQAADLDKDGDADLAITSSNAVMVFLNNAANFTSGQTVAVGTLPESLALTDFDNDGDVDAIVPNYYNGGISILTNSGNGTLSVSSFISTGSGPTSIATGDFDGDGKVDFAVYTSLSFNLLVFRGNGRGNFSQLASYGLNYGTRLLAADFDGDGDLDLAAAGTNYNSVSIFENSGRGVFTENRYAGLGSMVDISAADLDLDGSVDISSLNNNPSGRAVSLQFNAVDHHAPKALSGAFQTVGSGPSISVRLDSTVTSNLNAADFRVVNTSTSATIAVTSLVISSDGTRVVFQLPATLPDGNYRLTLAAGSLTDSVGNRSTTAFNFDFFSLAGDANHDGKVDVVDLGILSSNWQKSGATFAQGDFNYDGKVDVVDLGILSSNWQKTLPALVNKAITQPVKIVTPRPVKKVPTRA